MEKNLDITKRRYREHILPVSWPLDISRFYRTAQAGSIKKKMPIWGANTADIIMLNKNGKGTELFKITFTVEHPIH